MAYFPMFTDLCRKNILIVGGGDVALRKVKVLIPFAPHIFVIASHFKQGFQEDVLSAITKYSAPVAGCPKAERAAEKPWSAKLQGHLEKSSAPDECEALFKGVSPAAVAAYPGQGAEDLLSAELAGRPGKTITLPDYKGTIHFLERAFRLDDLLDADVVIAASDDPTLHAEIAKACRQRRIPVNIVDNKQLSSFIFPSLVLDDPLCIGISSGGASPRAVQYLKERIGEQIPEHFAAMLQQLENWRIVIKANITDAHLREHIFSVLFSQSIKKGSALSDAEIHACVLELSGKDLPLDYSSSSALVQGSAVSPSSLSFSPKSDLPQNADAGKTESLGQARSILDKATTSAGTESQCRERKTHKIIRPGVSLVGAGCSSADLITVRGLRCIQQADVLMHDDLIDPELLCEAPPGCEIIPVGKRAGCPSPSQADIEKILIEKAQEGKYVVRLKGGDPFVFGRGSEEVQALQAAGIAYEVIPGISSCIAIPEEAGIPVTHRAISRSFHVYTGHSQRKGPLSPANEAPSSENVSRETSQMPEMPCTTNPASVSAEEHDTKDYKNTNSIPISLSEQSLLNPHSENLPFSINVSRETIREGSSSNSSFAFTPQQFQHVDGTLVFLMGLAALPEIVRTLLLAERPVDEPVAVISGGNAPHPQTIRATLGTVLEEIQRHPVQAPAVIVVGPTASFHF